MTDRPVARSENEAAERLREWIPTAENADGESAPVSLDDALATERRLTVERVKARIYASMKDKGFESGKVVALFDDEFGRILDEEANR